MVKRQLNKKTLTLLKKYFNKLQAKRITLSLCGHELARVLCNSSQNSLRTMSCFCEVNQRNDQSLMIFYYPLLNQSRDTPLYLGNIFSPFPDKRDIMRWTCKRAGRYPFRMERAYGIFMSKREELGGSK